MYNFNLKKVDIKGILHELSYYFFYREKATTSKKLNPCSKSKKTASKKYYRANRDRILAKKKIYYLTVVKPKRNSK